MLSKYNIPFTVKFGMQLTCFFCICMFSTGSYSLSIKHVSHTPVKSLYIAGEEITVHFNLDAVADVELKIYDDREYLIRTIKSNAALEQGDHVLKWDGVDGSGKAVPYESYHYTLEANSESENVIYDVTDLTGNKKGVLRNLKWDRKTNIISYTLIKGSRVNFRIGISDGGPLLKTIINWQPRAQGDHIEYWNGYGESKQFNIANIANARLFSDAYTLSKNSIIIGKKIRPSQYIEVTDPEFRERKQSKKTIESKFRLAQERRDYPVAIKLPETEKYNKNLPIYSGKVSVKIDISKAELARLHENRFEPILFVDGQYVSELETGFFPVTWQLDTSKYKTGEHYITINVRGYNGQYGTSTQIIFVDNGI